MSIETARASSLRTLQCLLLEVSHKNVTCIAHCQVLWRCESRSWVLCTHSKEGGCTCVDVLFAWGRFLIIFLAKRELVADALHVGQALVHASGEVILTLDGLRGHILVECEACCLRTLGLAREVNRLVAIHRNNLLCKISLIRSSLGCCSFAVLMTQFAQIFDYN